jgi:3-oxoacyl-[acyl-carrier-protein] synthase-3
MLEGFQEQLGVDDRRLPIMLDEYGNTVSSTIPFLMHDLRASGRIKRGTRSMLVGFGVGFSWAGCVWQESWQPRRF